MRSSALLAALAAFITLPSRSMAQDDFPFAVSTEPVIRPGPSGSWDAGGVFGSRVIRDSDGYVLVYIGQERVGTFDNRLAVGVARSVDAIAWEKVAANPVLVPEQLHPRATGVEPVTLLGVDDLGVRLLVMAVDAKRGPLAWYEARLLPTARVEVGPELVTPEPASGSWNDRFRGPEAVLGEIPGGLSLLGSGCCGSGAFVIGEAQLENGQLAWGDQPVLQRGPLGTWDRQQVFTPQVLTRDGIMIMLYSGAPGAVGSDVFQHTIGFVTGDDGVSWHRPASENRLIAPQPGDLIEYPFLLEEGSSDRLFVTIKPHPDGLHAIHAATGLLRTPG